MILRKNFSMQKLGCFNCELNKPTQKCSCCGGYSFANYIDMNYGIVICDSCEDERRMGTMIVMNDICNTMIRRVDEIDAVQMIDDKHVRVYTRTNVFELLYQLACDATQDRERLKQVVTTKVDLLEDDNLVGGEHNG